MNTDNLHKLINRYTDDYYTVNNSEHDEVFKWAAIKQFRDVWFSDKYKNIPFARKFNDAKKECSILIDNKQVSPTNGIVKMAEAAPNEVESLFENVLFSNSTDPKTIQNNMDKFIEKIEIIRQRYFPQCWKYKQDRHAVSCYLYFYAPEINYIYRYREAEEFAKYTEFGFDLGSGESFSLPNYYKLCDIIVDALKEHEDLISEYKKLIKDNDKYYYDKSLHLLAFDLIYCCKTYNFYSGLEHKPKKDSIKEYKLEQLREKEKRDYEEKIDNLRNQIYKIESQMEEYGDISILNVEVNHKIYGVGTVVSQNANKITVVFPDAEKKLNFVINKKYSMRPTFLDDDEIVEAFTQYDLLNEKKKSLLRELSHLEKKL